MNEKRILKHIDDIKSFVALIGIFFNNGNLNRMLTYHNSILKLIKKLKYEFKNTDKTSLFEIRISRELLGVSRATIKDYEEVYFHPGYDIAEFNDFYESASSQLKSYEKEFYYELLKGKQWFY